MGNILHLDSISEHPIKDSARVRETPKCASLTLLTSTPAKLTAADLQARINTPEQRQRRKHARGVWEMFDTGLRLDGHDDHDRHDIWVISCKLYERDGEACDTPRELSIAAIAAAMGCTPATARNRLSKLFNHRIPEKGRQVLTRFKAEEDSGERHKYAADLFPIAAAYAELHEEEKATILRDRSLDRKEKGIKIAASMESLAREMMAHVPKCDTELLDPEGKTYAYVSGPEASA